VADMFQIPRLEQTADGRVRVARWGRIGGVLLRAADRVVLGPEMGTGLLVLVPRGYGRPMLGRRGPGGLIAEPAGVPASSLRWRVAGRILAIERDLERGGAGSGGSYVACRVEGRDLASLARARGVFMDAQLTERELIALCGQAAVALETHQVEVAIAAASSQAAAEALLADTPVSRIRMEMPALRPQGELSGVVVPGPWEDCLLPDLTSYVPEQLLIQSVSGSHQTVDDDPQLSLFEQRETA